MNLPREPQCLELFRKYKVPFPILQHCQQVRKIASFLAKKLQQKGLPLHPELVEKAALLHDLFKVISLERLDGDYPYSPKEIAMWRSLREKYPSQSEGQALHSFLRENYPELASLIKDFCDHQKTSHTWEETILFYADARVLKTQIVPLSERLSYVQKTYSHLLPDFPSFCRKVQQCEERIMKELDLDPEKLAEEIANEN